MWGQGICIFTSSSGTPGEVQLGLGTTKLVFQSWDSGEAIFPIHVPSYWPLTWDKALGLLDSQFFHL